MPQIKILPVVVVNKIAAGEVIDRPASVVKELIENAIDAGASRIDTYLEDGGRKRIQVTDDGIGMDKEDIAIAFQSHATSKLQDADDLFSIRTLGFRGEALPSIGAVSRACIISRARGTLHGTEIRNDGGVLGEIKERGAPEGTQVEIQDLFFNTPVRKKFLKTVATEIAYISDVLTRFSLSYPKIHFTLRHNNRTVFNLPPVRDVAERIGMFFSEEMRKYLIPIFLREEKFTLSGYMAPPFYDKANARMQFIFLNGRYIKDGAIFRAITEAYHGKLMHKRYPIVFLFLEMEPSEVDVNVHPTKTEVRFQNPGKMYSCVLSILKDGLNKSATKFISASLPMQRSEKELVKTEGVDHIKKSLEELFSLKNRNENSANHVPTEKYAGTFLHSYPSQEKDKEDTGSRQIAKPDKDIQMREEVNNRRATFLTGDIKNKRIYFQIHNSYIIEETEDGLNIIDQHALHEIILYHEIERTVHASKPVSQRLLIPELVELSPKDFYTVTSLKGYLKSVGIEVEEFGQSTIVIRTFPQILKQVNAKEFIEYLLSELSEDDYFQGKDKILDRLINIMACKGAVKSGQRLELQEIEELLKKRTSIDEYINSCPHGRPTTVSFSLEELQKQFKRK
jgi:DNA mismatch repair protein MutL